MNEPLVSVIVTHHLDINAPYLKVCLEALRASKGVMFDVLTVSDTKEKPQKPYDDHFSSLWSADLDTAKKKVDTAMGLISPKSTHVLLLSDDVIVSEYLLYDLFSAFKGRDMIMNPMSNSDVGSLYEADLMLDPLFRMKPDMDIENFSPAHIQKLMQYRRKDGKLLLKCPWVSFYCTMLTKKVWNLVGPLDEDFEYRHSDQDYCMRAAQAGFGSFINLGAFAFHFGSRTLKHTSDEVKNEASRKFMDKWKIR